MDKYKVFCVGCSQDIDPDTHVNCTPNFDDMLALDEKDGTENFRQNRSESAVQPQQESNSCELRRGNQDINSEKRKDTETLIKTPIKIITRNRDSTSPQILGAHNLEVQLSQNTTFGNSISRLQDYGLHHDSSEALHSETFPGNQEIKSAKRKQHTETSIQTSTNTMVVDSNMKPTSPRILGAHNLEVQRSQNTTFGNSISRLQDYGLHHDSSEALYSETFPGNQEIKSAKRKQHTETSIQTPTNTMVVDSNMKPTSPRILGAHNLEFQRSENTGSGNSVSRHEENYGLHHDPSEAFYAENFTGVSYLPYPTYIKNRAEQNPFGNVGQQQYELQSAILQGNERNILHQSDTQLTCGQTFATNVLQPGNISDLRPVFMQQFPQNGMNAFKNMQNSPNINHPLLPNRNVMYGPYLNKMNLDFPTSVEYNPENLKELPIGSELTADSNYPMKDCITANMGIDYLGQSKFPSTDLVSKTETQDSSFDKLGTSSHINFLMNCTQLIEHRSADKITLQEQPESNMYQKNEVRNTYKNSQQKQADNSAQQKYADQFAQQKLTYPSTQQKIAEKIAPQKNVNQTAPQKNVNQTAPQKNAVKSIEQKNAEKTAQKKNAVKSIKKKNEENISKHKNEENISKHKNVKASASQKNAEKSAKQKLAESSTQEKDMKLDITAKFTQQKNEEKVTQQENAKNGAKEEKAGIFTGKGYESIEEFIKALKDGTLYKRY